MLANRSNLFLLRITGIQSEIKVQSQNGEYQEEKVGHMLWFGGPTIEEEQFGDAGKNGHGESA